MLTTCAEVRGLFVFFIVGLEEEIFPPGCSGLRRFLTHPGKNISSSKQIQKTNHSPFFILHSQFPYYTTNAFYLFPVFFMKRLCMIGLLIASAMMAPALTSAVFDDVSVDTELHKAVQFLEVRGGLAPKPQFDGLQPVNKVVFLKMLLAPIKLSPVDQAAANAVVLKFTDVDTTAWYAPMVQKAVFLGLIANEAKALNPDGWMMRGEGLRIAMDAYGLPAPYLDTNINQQYGDVYGDSMNKSVVARAKKFHLIEDYGQRLFGVFAPLSKAETALVTYRLQNLLNDFARPQVEEEKDIPTITVDVNTDNEVQLDTVDNSLLNAVLDQVEEGYRFPEKIDHEKLSYGAIKGMVDGLGDPYTQFLPPIDAESFEASLDGEVEGIGTYVEGVDLGLRIESIIPGTPAEKAGLKGGDTIVTVDGLSLKGMNAREAASKIRGPKGSTVKLEVLRDGVIVSFTVVRDAFEITSITKEERNGMYILKIADFRDTTGAEFATYVDGIRNARPKVLVLDLRNNRGGYLSSSLQILRHFFPKDTPLLTIDYGEGKGILDYKSTEAGDLLDVPVTILVNGNTASAAEILAGTMQDHKRAKLIGETTYGKGTVQGLIDFTDKSSLKMTIAKWLTGNGRWVNEWTDENNVVHKGLIPDVPVARGNLDTLKEEFIKQDKALDVTFDQNIYNAVEQNY